jgi:hypothetical protein
MLFVAGPADAARDDVPTPKEYGAYAKTEGGLKRILPNMVYDEKSVYFLESNSPQSFPLNSVQYFIIYGKYQMQYLTLNNMKPFRVTPFGKVGFMFGLEVEIDVKKKSDTLYTVKPKGLFGRGYYSLWIEDTAWDFRID